MAVEHQIQAAASQNSHLLGILSETDYAVPALARHKRYIVDLEGEIRKLDLRIKTLETARVKELKEHEKYRDSTMKRFAYKVGRRTEKFDAKASKEEREYFEALQEEHRAKETRKDLGHRLGEAQTARSNLEPVVARHGQAQGELDALYDSIFEGPTPSFPDEDRKEQSAEMALSAYHDFRTRTEAEGQAVKILSDAQRKMKRAITSMTEALSCSQVDMFGGGIMTDMMERNALSDAELMLSQCQAQVAQAQRMSPGVRDLPPVRIAKGSLMSDVFFDNIFTDMAFHDKIKASMAEVQKAADALAGQLEEARQRHQDMERDLSGISRSLEDSRVALQKAREYAFEQVVGR